MFHHLHNVVICFWKSNWTMNFNGNRLVMPYFLIPCCRPAWRCRTGRCGRRRSSSVCAARPPVRCTGSSGPRSSPWCRWCRTHLCTSPSGRPARPWIPLESGVNIKGTTQIYWRFSSPSTQFELRGVVFLIAVCCRENWGSCNQINTYIGPLCYYVSFSLDGNVASLILKVISTCNKIVYLSHWEHRGASCICIT